MKNMQKGFTLIELMIVVAIIGILAAVAIPSYKDYTVKAKMSSAVSSLGGLQAAVALCAQEAGGVLDGCDTTIPGGVETNIPVFTATSVLASASVANGVITAKMANGVGTGVDALDFKLTPTITDTNTKWKGDVGAAPLTNIAAVKYIKDMGKE